MKSKQLNYPGHDSSGICFDDYFIPIPTYVNITYNVTLRSEYQQQMNDMITPFITYPGQVNHFVFKKDNHKYEAFVQQDFAMNNNITNMGEEERKFSNPILNRKVNFDMISMNENYSASEEDLKYYKDTFENIIFDESFLRILDFKKIKKFIVEIS